MVLVDVYIHEVTIRLPEKMREDIGLELRSTIEDMLPDDASEKDIKAVLNELGSPAKLASGYSEQPMHLIGPRYFDAYFTLLKMMLPISAIIAVIVMLAEVFTNPNAPSIFDIVFDEGLATFASVLMQIAFWMTLLFAILERTDKTKGEKPLTPSLKEWSADDLKQMASVTKKKAVTKKEVFLSLLWTAIWGTIYIHADKIIGVYENKGDGLEFVLPALNQTSVEKFWPIVVVVLALEALFAIYKWIVGRWTNRLAIANAVLQVVATVVFLIMLTSKNFMTPQFVAYMGDVFNTSNFESSFVLGVILIFVISAALSIFDGFKKAKRG